MKKIRVIFGVLAVMLAAGGALASKSFAPDIHGYEYVGGNCVDRGLVCKSNGTVACMITSPVTGLPVRLREFEDSTTCGEELNRE